MGVYSSTFNHMGWLTKNYQQITESNTRHFLYSIFGLNDLYTITEMFWCIGMRQVTIHNGITKKGVAGLPKADRKWSRENRVFQAFLTCFLCEKMVNQQLWLSIWFSINRRIFMYDYFSILYDKLS